MKDITRVSKRNDVNASCEHREEFQSGLHKVVRKDQCKSVIECVSACVCEEVGNVW